MKLAVALAAATLSLVAHDARACSCRPQSDSLGTAMVHSEAIFEGELIAIEPLEGCNPDRRDCVVRYRFRVFRAWRGISEPTVDLFRVVWSCDLSFERLGYHAILYAGRRRTYGEPFDETLHVTMCQRHAEGSEIGRDAKALGKPEYVPAPGAITIP